VTDEYSNYCLTELTATLYTEYYIVGQITIGLQTSRTQAYTRICKNNR